MQVLRTRPRIVQTGRHASTRSNHNKEVLQKAPSPGSQALHIVLPCKLLAAVRGRHSTAHHHF